MKTSNKKGVMNQVIGVFILVLVIAVLSGMTFLFTSNLKNNVQSAAVTETRSVVNETGYINKTGYQLSKYNEFGFADPSIVLAINATSKNAIASGNYTLDSTTGIITNASAQSWSAVDFTYTYSAIADSGAYNAVNQTEAAGATVINYLPLLFLALIFGAVLIVVLRVILPYINLGNQMNTGF